MTMFICMLNNYVGILYHGPLWLMALLVRSTTGQCKPCQKVFFVYKSLKNRIPKTIQMARDDNAACYAWTKETTTAIVLVTLELKVLF